MISHYIIKAIKYTSVFHLTFAINLTPFFLSIFQFLRLKRCYRFVSKFTLDNCSHDLEINEVLSFSSNVDGITNRTSSEFCWLVSVAINIDFIILKSDSIPITRTMKLSSYLKIIILWFASSSVV